MEISNRKPTHAFFCEPAMTMYKYKKVTWAVAPRFSSSKPLTTLSSACSSAVSSSLSACRLDPSVCTGSRFHGNEAISHSDSREKLGTSNPTFESDRGVKTAKHLKSTDVAIAVFQASAQSSNSERALCGSGYEVYLVALRTTIRLD